MQNCERRLEENQEKQNVQFNEIGYFRLYTHMPYKGADWGEEEPLLYFPYLRGTVTLPRRTKRQGRNEGRRKIERRRARHDVREDPVDT